MSAVTIKMPAELLAKWLAALRSGQYRQASGQMFNGDGYCCLGVLQVAVDGTVRNGSYPSPSWCQENAVEFFCSDGKPRSNQPYLPSLHELAGDANDQGRTFAEIADAIEACAEGI